MFTLPSFKCVIDQQKSLLTKQKPELEPSNYLRLSPHHQHFYVIPFKGPTLKCGLKLPPVTSFNG